MSTTNAEEDRELLMIEDLSQKLVISVITLQPSKLFY